MIIVAGLFHAEIAEVRRVLKEGNMNEAFDLEVTASRHMPITTGAKRAKSFSARSADLCDLCVK